MMVGENLAENADALGFSRNHGQSWSVVPLPEQWAAASITPDFVGCTSRSCLLYGSNIFAISGKDPALGYHVSLVSTTDNGETWSLASLAGLSNDLDSLVCIGSGKCWALYRSQTEEEVGVSFDEGKTWTTVGSVVQAFDPDHFAGFACADSSICYIIDNSNGVFFTSNGGRRWQPGIQAQNQAGSTRNGRGGLCASRRPMFHGGHRPANIAVEEYLAGIVAPLWGPIRSVPDRRLCEALRHIGEAIRSPNCPRSFTPRIDDRRASAAP
jgi:hypothetical protein